MVGQEKSSLKGLVGTMSELQQKVSKSIERLKAFEPKTEPYYLAFSGGKDSVVCKALLDMSGCKYDAVYRVTSVDPPELIRFIKKEHSDVIREVPRDANGKPITMWNLIPKKMLPPTRHVRYCCQYLKESGGDGRKTVTGVRWAESVNRKKNQGIVTFANKNKRLLQEISDNSNFFENKSGGVVLNNDNADSRKMVEQCYKRHKTTVNPIIDWTDADVWEFINAECIPYCELYNEGFLRLGCIGCPMASRRERERELYRWGKYKDAYLRAFDMMLRERKLRERKTEWQTSVDVMNWWLENDVLSGQVAFEDYEDENYV